MCGSTLCSSFFPLVNIDFWRGKKIGGVLHWACRPPPGYGAHTRTHTYAVVCRYPPRVVWYAWEIGSWHCAWTCVFRMQDVGKCMILILHKSPIKRSLGTACVPSFFLLQTPPISGLVAGQYAFSFPLFFLRSIFFPLLFSYILHSCAMRALTGGWCWIAQRKRTRRSSATRWKKKNNNTGLVDW